MGRVILSAFADEFSSDIDTQIKMLSENGIGYIEPRFIGEKNISELSENEAKELKSKLNFANIGVYSLGSPLGKIKLSDDFDAHLELSKRIFENAAILGAQRVRMFSFYMRSGQTRAEARGEVIEKLGKMIELADSYGITLCHENEGSIYGESPEACCDILSAFGGKLKAVFDMGNFVLGGYKPYPDAYKLLSPYVDYFHIKDALYAGAIVPPGVGEASIKEILSEAVKGGDAVATLEPHLETFSGLGRLTGRTFNNPYKFESKEAAFLVAIEKIKKIAEEINGENL